jgi:PPK2 family polyphosphate:nucleotide phosphotransferase
MTGLRGEGRLTSDFVMAQPIQVRERIELNDFDPDFTDHRDKDKTKAQTAQLCQRIGELQELLYANSRHALLLIFQGMDASGKDGAIKSVLEFVNPVGVEATNFRAPTTEELAHDFLWRIHQAVPRYGRLGVFNRSHYEDVLAVRVLKLQPPEVWQRRFAQINAFEQLLVDNRVVLLKFFLHISKDEQAERFRERIANPKKHWKFSEADLKLRVHWKQFQHAYEDAINQCNPAGARWHIVPANHKWYRDFVVASAVVDALESLNMKWPRAELDFSRLKWR